MKEVYYIKFNGTNEYFHYDWESGMMEHQASGFTKRIIPERFKDMLAAAREFGFEVGKL